VFAEFEANELIREIEYIAPFADPHAPTQLPEYVHDYCMAAAERGLSRLLFNTTYFYAVDRAHNKLNNISFAGKNANDRGRTFASLGFVSDTFVFEDYQVHKDIMQQVHDLAGYQAHGYDAVTLAPGSDLLQFLQKTIANKPGFHVYYLSISDAFHTMLLVIDNRDPANELYTMYDQHGISTSAGRFEEIESGFARQTSWTVMNSYMNKHYDITMYTNPRTRLWKIQRQQHN
jgi:hypothetical protein